MRTCGIVVEAAWAYRHRPAIGKARAARQRCCSAQVTELVTAVARELLGFIWAIGVKVERAHNLPDETGCMRRCRLNQP